MALFLNEKEVAELLPMNECINVLENVFQQLADGRAENRPRSRIRLPKGFFHMMVAASVGFNTFGFKAYSIFPNRSKFTVGLYDGETGELLSLMEASTLGQVRTGAASGLATKYMARPDATTVGIIGTGYQARTQLEAVCAVRNIKLVRAYSRTQEKRQDFAREMSERMNIEVVPVDSGEKCTRDADVVIAITTSREPVLKGEWLSEGAHINAAGSNHWMRRELDEKVVERSNLIVVDDLEQAKIECGDLIWPAERGIFRWSQAYELKDVISGRVQGRPDSGSITLFESQGLAIEDIAAAQYVYRRARELGVGRELPI